MPNYVRTLLRRLGRRILDARRTRLVERRLRGFIGVVLPIGIVVHLRSFGVDTD